MIDAQFVILTNAVHTSGMWKQVAQIVKNDGWTLVELSRRTGIDKGQLSRFLRGERELRREALERLLGHLGLVVKVERDPFGGRAACASCGGGQIRDLAE
jgi:transcriptional regulator with XRE-family HTH domain